MLRESSFNLLQVRRWDLRFLEILPQQSQSSSVDLLCVVADQVWLQPWHLSSGMLTMTLPTLMQQIIQNSPGGFAHANFQDGIHQLSFVRANAVQPARGWRRAENVLFSPCLAHWGLWSYWFWKPWHLVQKKDSSQDVLSYDWSDFVTGNKNINLTSWTQETIFLAISLSRLLYSVYCMWCVSGKKLLPRSRNALDICQVCRDWAVRMGIDAWSSDCQRYLPKKAIQPRYTWLIRFYTETVSG